MKTIYAYIEESIKTANIPGIKYVKDYPMDYVLIDGDPIEDEEMDTMGPLLQAWEVIKCTIENFGDKNDDIRVCFSHLPGEETWGISIGDGR